VLREAGPGLFYLDEPSWEALRRFRRRVVVILAALVIAAALLALARRALAVGV
jgi:hypothetical protein